MPMATAKRSLEDIPQISKPYFINGNFCSAASCPRILTLSKVEGGNFGHKGKTWRGEKCTLWNGALWEMLGKAAPWELGENCVVLGDFTYTKCM